MTEWTVRGLRLPDLLIALLSAGLWQQPPAGALRDLMPWFEDPLILLSGLDQIQRENRSLDRLAGDERSARVFRLSHGGELPWLDVENAVLIAVNRDPGDDVAVALDYRTNRLDPRVVASDVWTDPRQYAWREVTFTFTEFVTRALEAPPRPG